MFGSAEFWSPVTIKFIRGCDTQNAMGSIPSPFDCWLILRSTKTLAVRMERHNYNALQFAKYLSNSKLAESLLPGLGFRSHPQHELATSQMRGFGGMISVILEILRWLKKS